MATRTKPQTHEECFAEAPPEARERLEAIRAEVERRVPKAERCVGYSMPAFRQKRIFFYFSAFKNHIGVYPPVHTPAGLVKRLAPYRGDKGNLAFPHSDPLPVELIGEVAAALARQNAA